MKRYHVLGATFLAGVVCGLALSFSAHAEEQLIMCREHSGKMKQVATYSMAQGEGSLSIGSEPVAVGFSLVKEGQWVNDPKIGRWFAQVFDGDSAVATLITNDKNQARLMVFAKSDDKILLNAGDCLIESKYKD